MPRLLRAWTLLALPTLLVLSAARAEAAEWPPLSPADRALATPAIDPNADAEALVWDVRITDSTEHDYATHLDHYVKIKIFTDRGREAHSKVELTYTGSRRVRDIEGRTTSPTGAVTELKPQDIFDRTVVETSGVKVRAKSFVLPAAVPGSIIEYRWREVRDDAVSHYLELPLQMEVPAHEIRYHLKPLALRYAGFQMRTEWFNIPGQLDSAKEDGGYTVFSSRRVPAFRKERFMPPELSVKRWMLVYYADLMKADKAPDKFWAGYAKDMLDLYKPHMKSTPEVQQVAADVKKTTPSPTIEAVMAAVRKRVKRDDLTAEDRAARKETKTATDGLKRGSASGVDMTLISLAVARTLGVDARLAFLPDRTHTLVDPNGKHGEFVSHIAVAVKDGASWRIVDPGNAYAKNGLLDWRYNGQFALVADEKTPQLIQVPIAGESDAIRTRRATMSLSEDGTLTGDVALTFSGHAGSQRRRSDVDDSPQDREKALLEDITGRIPGAAVTKVAFEHFDNPDEPYTIRYSLTVPGYAQRTGSRLFATPALFQRGVDAVFAESTRTHNILFPYAYRDEDTVVLSVPEGYTLEPAQTAGPLTAGDLAVYETTVTPTDNNRSITFSRVLTVGPGGRVLTGATSYPGLKAFFDDVHKRDAAVVTLRRAAAAQ